MDAITKFKTYDGSEFDDRVDAEKYEADCRIADAIIAQLPPLPKEDGCRFSNGHGFIQHDPKLFARVRLQLLQQAAKETDHKWIRESIEDPTVHASWAARIISESCTDQLHRAWYRIHCTDSQFREWGQPFYAGNNGQGAEHICVNAKPEARP